MTTLVVCRHYIAASAIARTEVVRQNRIELLMLSSPEMPFVMVVAAFVVSAAVVGGVSLCTVVVGGVSLCTAAMLLTVAFIANLGSTFASSVLNVATNF